MDSTLMCAAIKRSGSRKRTHNRRFARRRPALPQKKFTRSILPQEIHESSTGFPQLDLFQSAHYP
jgi:hypothetical protein